MVKMKKSKSEKSIGNSGNKPLNYMFGEVSLSVIWVKIWRWWGFKPGSHLKKDILQGGVSWYKCPEMEGA